MNLEFKINKELLFASILFNDRKKHKSLFVPLKNKLWDKYPFSYSHFLRGKDYRLFFTDTKTKLDKLTVETLKMVEEGMNSSEFKEIYKTTEEYFTWLKKEYTTKLDEINKHLKDILKVDMPDEPCTVYILDPRVGGGTYMGNREIFWGHTEDWSNYNVVYLAHEFLHTFLPRSDVAHCVIELATDNELRIRLNGKGEYFEEEGQSVGHPNLLEDEKNLLPSWQQYLTNPNQNIFDFIEDSKKKTL